MYGGRPTVLRGRLPQHVFDDLSDRGLIRTGSVPGFRFFPHQVVALPEALPVMNRYMRWELADLAF
jgi:hypothetical protein